MAAMRGARRELVCVRVHGATWNIESSPQRKSVIEARERSRVDQDHSNDDGGTKDDHCVGHRLTIVDRGRTKAARPGTRRLTVGGICAEMAWGPDGPDDCPPKSSTSGGSSDASGVESGKASSDRRRGNSSDPRKRSVRSLFPNPQPPCIKMRIEDGNEDEHRRRHVDCDTPGEEKRNYCN